jgi:hypothetical protein
LSAGCIPIARRFCGKSSGESRILDAHWDVPLNEL